MKYRRFSHGPGFPFLRPNLEESANAPVTDPHGYIASLEAIADKATERMVAESTQSRFPGQSTVSDDPSEPQKSAHEYQQEFYKRTEEILHELEQAGVSVQLTRDRINDCKKGCFAESAGYIVGYLDVLIDFET